MKRKLFFFVIVAFFMLAMPTFAEESTSERLWDEYVGVVDKSTGGIDAQGGASGIGVESLLGELVSAVGDGIGEAGAFCMMLFGIAIVMAVSDSVTPIESSLLSKNTSAAISVVSAVLIFGRIGRLCYSVRESLVTLSAFFSGLIPILTGILSAGGSHNSAASQAFNMNVTLGAVSYLTDSVLIPLVFALFSLALAANTDAGAVSSVAKGIKNAFMWGVGIGTAIIIGAVSMQSVITGAEDSAYLRAAKYAAGGMIPVVGSTVSGALSTLAGGLSYVKSAVGVSSVFVIVTLALSPLITMLLYRLAFSMSITLLDFMGVGGGVRTFTAFKSSLDALISVYSLSAIVYISELVVFMKSGVSVFG